MSNFTVTVPVGQIAAWFLVWFLLYLAARVLLIYPTRWTHRARQRRRARQRKRLAQRMADAINSEVPPCQDRNP